MSPQVALEPANPGDLVRPGSPKVKVQFSPSGTICSQLAGAFAPLLRARWRARLCRVAQWTGTVYELEEKDANDIVDFRQPGVWETPCPPFPRLHFFNFHPLPQPPCFIAPCSQRVAMRHLRPHSSISPLHYTLPSSSIRPSCTSPSPRKLPAACSPSISCPPHLQLGQYIMFFKMEMRDL